MHHRTIDLKTLTIGVLLGVCLMLARGAADAPAKGGGATTPRYQISATTTQANGTTAGMNLVVLDNADNSIRVYDWNATQWRDVDRMSLTVGQ